MVTIDSIRRIVANMIAPLKRRIQGAIVRGVIELVDDSTKMQVVQVTVGDNLVKDGVERIQQYGFTSVPEKDAEAVVLQVGGVSSHLLVIATEDRDARPVGMEPGEGALYTKAHGILVKLDKNGIANLGAAAGDEFIALADKTKTELDALAKSINDLKTVFTTWVPVPTDGGAALKAAAGAWFAAPVTISSVAATKTKAT